MRVFWRYIYRGQGWGGGLDELAEDLVLPRVRVELLRGELCRRLDIHQQPASLRAPRRSELVECPVEAQLGWRAVDLGEVARLLRKAEDIPATAATAPASSSAAVIAIGRITA